MEEGGGGGDDPATRAAGGMCDRFLTFLARNLSMSKVKSVADGPKNGGGDAGQPAIMEGGEEGGEGEDEFAIPIERAEFDYEFAGGGHGDGGHSSSVATILEESAVRTTTMTRDVPEPKTAADDPVGVVGPAPAVAVEETKVRKSVTIKEDRPPEQQEGGAPPLKRKRLLFKKRQASSSAAAGGGDEHQRVPKRSGLRPRMPPVLRVPSNINERSSTFIEERKKSFVGRGGAANKPPAPDKRTNDRARRRRRCN